MAGYTTPAWANGAAPAISADNLQAMGQGIELAQHPYGVCSTAAATAAKSVTIDFSGTLSLFAGHTVRIKFSNSNTAPNPTLNVNGTGAKPIMAYGTTNAGTWIAGQTLSFTYDGLYNGVEAFTKEQTLSSATAAAFNSASGILPATPDAALNILANALSGTAHLAVGSYVGTGTYGQSNPTSISFPFVPVLVIVYRDEYGIAPYSNMAWYESFVWVANESRIESAIFMQGSQGAGTYIITNYTTLSGTSLSWYATYQMTPEAQFNSSGRTYKYIALGTI